MSNRVTKSMAEAAAAQLAENAYSNKMEAAKFDLRQWAIKYFLKYVPQEVRSVATEHIKWFEGVRSLSFVKEGGSYYDYKIIHFDMELARLNPIVLNKEDWDKLNQADRVVSNLSKEWKDFELEVTTALVNLRTEKNVREQFPEALPYLNFSSCTALVPNINNLRSKLNGKK